MNDIFSNSFYYGQIVGVFTFDIDWLLCILKHRILSDALAEDDDHQHAV